MPIAEDEDENPVPVGRYVLVEFGKGKGAEVEIKKSDVVEISLTVDEATVVFGYNTEELCE